MAAFLARLIKSVGLAAHHPALLRSDERVRHRQGGTDTRFIYDGDDLAAEVNASGARIRAYAYWPGIDQPHSMRTWESGQNGATYYYALDLPSNNMQGLFGTAGSVAARYDYSPFGEAYTSSATVTNPLRFAARELDASTGLYYVRARWYDPYLGRFISEDPIGLAGGINNYAYALNDPVNLSDPTGLCYRYKNGREAVVSVPGWEGGEPEYCEPWFPSMTDQAFSLLGDPFNRPVPGSYCDFLGCILRKPSSAEVERVQRVLNSVRDDIPFCQQVKEHGLAAAARNLRFFDNPLFPGPGEQLFGESPYDRRLNGPVMYLYGPKLRDSDIVHEAVHDVPRRTNPFQGYPDATHPYFFTPLGSIDQTAAICMGG